MKITKVQKKLVEEIYGKGDFYEVEEVLYFHSADAEKTYRVDFDNEVYKRMDGSVNSKDTTLQKKQKEEIEAENERVREDITPAQVEEHYWVETPLTKKDSSFAMYEARVAKEMEARGIPREQARKEVKTKLKKEKISVINTEDMEKEKEKKEDEEVEEDEDEKKDISEDLSKLKEENEKLKTDLIEAQKVNTDMKSDFKETMDYVDKIKKEREGEVEEKRQDKIKQLMTDFVGVTEDSLKDKTMEQLEDTENILSLAVKKDTKEDMVIEPAEQQKHNDLLEAKFQAITEKYRCNV